MQSKNYRYIELLILFILIPLSYTLNYSPIIKLVIGVLGFIYIAYIILKVEKIKNKHEDKIKIEVKKSSGKKCTLCWKILDKKCKRKHCGVN